MQPKTSPKRPRLTLKFLAYAIVDVVGMVVFATGAIWLTQGTRLFFTDFPANEAQALTATIGGVLLMFWAATQILRELIRRPMSNPRTSK
jgi:hypothetical protein